MNVQEAHRIKVCVVVAAPMTVNAFLVPHLIALSEQYHVTLIFNGRADQLPLSICHIPVIRVPIVRNISPRQDMIALFKLIRLFRKERFNVVHSVTPKAGFLAALAGFVAQVPTRIHWFTGQVWATKRGFLRQLLKVIDRITVACTTHQLVDSHSQRMFLADQGVLGTGCGVVLASGSICGVDLTKFQPNAQARSRIRASLGIAETDSVALFVGRLQPEKGVLEVAQAFRQVADACPKLHLVLAGPDEAGIEASIKSMLEPVRNRLHSVGFVNCPEQYMAACDFLLIPSHREGFGSVVIEAAACEIPSIGTNIYGLSDAIIDGKTGILIPRSDVSALEFAMRRLALGGDECRALGEGARMRVLDKFQQSIIVDALLEFYKHTLDLNRHQALS
ncbi:MAG: glycosyltransferase family 1 protein [Planctomycetes bacterium]|jgi:glycosyltransferase involved in cell wall biosynthesis|nr:glycosyltransferase family 1 protein [Planctomycetota bacterium]